MNITLTPTDATTRITAEIQDACQAICGNVFDESLVKDSPKLYEHFITTARILIAAQDGLGDESQVAAKSQEDTPEGLALRARVLAVAREKFVASCIITPEQKRASSRMAREGNLGKAWSTHSPTTKTTEEVLAKADRYLAEK